MIPAGQDFAGYQLRVLEADVSAYNLHDACVAWEDANDRWDGIMICYDVTEENSLLHVEDLLRTCESYRLDLLRAQRPHTGAFGHMNAPRIVLACKSELELTVKPDDAVSLLKAYDTGLVEASAFTELGKERIRKAFQWVFKALVRQQGVYLRRSRSVSDKLTSSWL